MADLQDTDTAITNATKPDNAKALGIALNKIPIIGKLVSKFDPALVAKDPSTKGLLGRAILRFEGQQKSQQVNAYLNRLGKVDDIFGKADTEGRLTQSQLKGLTVNDIASDYSRYDGMLDQKQKDYMAALREIGIEIKDFLKRNGVDIHELGFADDGFWGARRVVGKWTAEGELIEVAGIARPGPGRPGAKTAMEKTRVFRSQEEAIAAGFRYMNQDEATSAAIQSAYNRVADKQMAEWFFDRVDWRTTKAPERLIMAAEQAHEKLRVAQVTLAAINRGARGERLPEATLRMIGRFYRLQASAMRTAGGPGGFRPLRGLAKQNLTAAKAEYWQAVSARAKGAEEAARVKFDEARVLAPAFQGKILTGANAREMADVLNRGFDQREIALLTGLNKYNAVRRFVQLAGDVSWLAIQNIMLATYKPATYAKSARYGFEAIFHPRVRAQYLDANRAIIQGAPDLKLAGQGVDITEALQANGLLKKGLLSPAGKLLEPFQRGLETALDVAGIELRKSMAHMARNADEAKQVDEFINKLRGMSSSSKLGTSLQFRQVESMASLAPQYNRAIFALAADIARGGIRGNEARKAVGSMILGSSASIYGINLALTGSHEKALHAITPMEKDPNGNWRRNPEYMMFTIGNQRIGFGSKMVSLINLAATFTAAGTKGDISGMEEAIERWARSNGAPIVSDGIDIIMGKTYVGDKTRESVMGFAKEMIGKKFVPLSAATGMFENGDLGERLAQAGVQFVGGRGYTMEPVQRLRREWEVELAPYGNIPTDPKEIEAKRQAGEEALTRLEWRKENPESEAKLFIQGNVNSLKTTEAVDTAVKLIRDNKIDPMGIEGIDKRLKDLEKARELGLEPPEKDTFLDSLLKDLGLYGGKAKAAGPEEELTPTPEPGKPPQRLTPDQRIELKSLMKQWKAADDAGKRRLQWESPLLDRQLRRTGHKPLTEVPPTAAQEVAVIQHNKLPDIMAKYEDLLKHPERAGIKGIETKLPEGLTLERLQEWREYKWVVTTSPAIKEQEWLVNHRAFADWYLAKEGKAPLPEKLTPEMFQKLQGIKKLPKDQLYALLEADPELHDYAVENDVKGVPSKLEVSQYLEGKRLKVRDTERWKEFQAMPEGDRRLRFQMEKEKDEKWARLLRERNVAPITDRTRQRLADLTPAIEKKLIALKDMTTDQQNEELWKDKELNGYWSKWATDPDTRAKAKRIAEMPISPKEYAAFKKLPQLAEWRERRKNADLERYEVEVHNKNPVPPVSYERYVKMTAADKLKLRRADAALNTWLETYTSVLPLRAYKKKTRITRVSRVTQSASRSMLR